MAVCVDLNCILDTWTECRFISIDGQHLKYDLNFNPKLNVVSTLLKSLNLQQTFHGGLPTPHILGVQLLFEKCDYNATKLTWTT